MNLPFRLRVPSALRDLIQNAFGRAGFRISRAGAENRFEAMETSLSRLAAMGYSPGVVIDVGANRGQWSRLASRIFPAAAFHLVEPQAAYADELGTLVAEHPGWNLHPVIATRPGVDALTLVGEGTGAHVVEKEVGPRSQGRSTTHIPASTLDQLVPSLQAREGRPLLKVDVEGHELEVLAGAEELLRRVEVVLAEVHFYDVEQSGHPLLLDLASFLDEAGFQLFDFASLSERRRDGRLRMGDAIFVARWSSLLKDERWA